MNKDKLSDDCQLGLSTRDMVVKHGKAQSTIRYWLEKYGLKTKFKNSLSKFTCRNCDENEPSNFYTGKSSLCKSCETINKSERSRAKKQMAVDYKGGKCEVCGYDKYIGALDFHHLDQKDKDPNFSSFRGWSDKRIKEELDKCKLLCANCHREAHGLINTLD